MEEGFVIIDAGKVKLEGNLVVPKEAQGIVLFAHGSGSSRHSPRNQYLAKQLQKAGLATLLIDLLTKEEERIDEMTRELRFNIGLLSSRLVGLIDWCLKDSRTKHLKIGLFGGSTGAAAALIAAAERGKAIKAVVSRGGRPDLALEHLSSVRSPTLLIVGGNDFAVIEMNEEALRELTCEKKLSIVPHATHLFEEKGALEEVALLTEKWFLQFLQG